MRLRIKKNDNVRVISGRDKGKTGRVLKVSPETSRALVEKINYVKKSTRKTKQDQQGGIIQKESPIHISNLMLVCPKCNMPTRIGVNTLKDGTKSRFCKKCQELLA